MSIHINDYTKRIKTSSTTSNAQTPSIDIEKAKEGYQKYLSDSSKESKNIFEKALDSVTDWGREKLGVAFLGEGRGNWFANILDKEAERNQNPDKPNDLWSEDQKNLFGYKYLSSPEEAYKYAVEVNNSITQQRNEKLAEEIGKDAASNFGNAALHTVNSIVTAPLSLVEYVDKLGDTAKYGTPITSPLYMSPTLSSEAAKSGIASKLNEYGTIDESVPIFGGRGLGDAYGLGTSIAQSAYSGVIGRGSALGASYTLATYFGQAATLGIEDALSRGANDKQALAYGTVVGLVEAILEMISVKSLIGITKAEGVQNVFKAVLKQAGEEATEEFTTSVLNEVADRWIMGGKSQYYMTVQELMGSGMSAYEAENKALSMTLENIAFDTISGAVSGGILGAGAAGISNINQKYLQTDKNARAKNDLTPKQNELIAEGKKYEQTAKRAASLEKKIADGKELSGYELRMLASEVAMAERASNVDTVRKAVIERMKAEGVSDSEAKRLGEIVLKKALGTEKPSVLEEGMLKRNKAALKVYNQMDAKNMESGMTDSDWVNETPLAQLRRDTSENEATPEYKSEDRNGQKNYKNNPESLEGKFAEAEGKIVYQKANKDSRIHTEEISTSLTKEDIAELSAFEKLANGLGIDIHVYESKLNKDGSRSYTDKDGNVITSSGYYDPNDKSIHIDLRAGDNGEGTMRYTSSHELVHFVKDVSSEHFDALEKLVTEALIEGGASIEKLIDYQRRKAIANGQNLTEAQLREEMVAEACQSFLASETAIDRIKALKTENRGFWNTLKRFFTSLFTKINRIYKTVEPDSYEGRYIANMRNGAKRIRDAFMEGVAAAGEKYASERKALGEGSNVKVNSEGEFVQGTSKDKKTIMTNARTWKSGGRATLKATLESEGFSAEDVNAALTIMDEHMKLVEQFGTKYTAQDIANNAVLTTDVKTGEAVLSAIISNGDYPVNIDLLTICKKREAYQQVINRLCESGMINNATIDSLAIAEINKILGKYGFETACLGCYVESRRIRIQEWAETIVKEWNGIVDKFEGKGKGQYLNASSDTFVADLSNEEISKLSSELESAYEREGLKYGRATVVKKMEQLQREVPSMRKYLTVSDLITSEGRSNIKAWSQELNSLINCRYGTNTPKIIQKFNPYNSELARYGIVPKAYNSLRDYLYAIGGARMQSFSDFIVENWFDYAQIVADLAARKLPMHTYTKEASLVKLFGMTGIKINMSLIPDVDSSLGKEYAGLTKNKNGEYELIFADKDRHKATGGKSYMQSFNFADAIALQNDPNYSANIGTIAIGISDKQIEMMLDDSRIRMVIPYHSSGMNPIFAHLVGIKNYNDYTNDQSTGVKRIVDSNGNERSVKLTKEQQAKLTRGFQYNEALQRLGDARKAAEEYKDWCRDTSNHSIEIDGKTYYAELTPKFEKFSAHENYYKLLTDYNAYDCITEESKPQQDVTQTYPENFADMLGDELKSRDIYAKKQDAKWDDAMAEINTYLESHTRADTVAYADEHGIKISAKDRKLAKQESAKKVIRHKARSVDTNGNELTEAQISYFKDSKIRDSKGNLKVLYHGTTADFNTFKKGDVGFHFGTKGAARGRVGYGKNVTIKEVYLNITNPIVFDDDLGSWDADYRLTQELYEKGILTMDEARTVLISDDGAYRRTTEAANKKLAEVLLSKGYDGIEYTNTHESKKDSTSYIIFDSKQAKLITNANPTESKDIRYKARGNVDSYTEYDKPITAEDTAILRTIGGISVNEFTTTDIEKAQKWAYKFYKELGTKSPFFRAWFGDWREYDNITEIKPITVPTIDITEAVLEHGDYEISDTEWIVHAGKILDDDTRHHTGGNRVNVKSLKAIKDILENAVLLDTVVSQTNTNKKSPNTAFLHKLYTAIKYDGRNYIAKIAIEEYYNETIKDISRRAFNLRAIKIEPTGGQLGNNSSSSVPDVSSIKSIADLFALVKQYDKDFSPKAANPLLLNDDGTPKVFYHGTRSQFTEFILQDKPTFGRVLGDGFYFTPSYSKAHQFANGLFSKGEDRGGIVMPVYLRMNNPFVIEETTDRTKWRNEYYKGDYDGIIDLKNKTWYVEDSTQIKSATDNIGTFNKGSTDIRHKARGTLPTATPYVSPTIGGIVTNIPSGYQYTTKDKIQSGIIASQIAFTNAQAGIEHLGKKYAVKDIEALVQSARVATNQAEEMIGGSQYRIGSDTKDYLGEGLQKIIQPIKEMGEQMESAFYDYLFHYHNADRMSLERRSIEWNDEKKADLKERTKKFSELEKEQKALTDEKSSLSRKKSDNARRGEINLRLSEIKREIHALANSIKKLQKEVSEFTALSNKPVIGMNREEIEAQKEELSNQISSLREQVKALGFKKENADRVKELKDRIALLTKDRSELSAEVSEEKSREIIAEYERNYDFFFEIAQKIWKYNENLNLFRVDTGLIDQSEFDYLKKLYPHYVPTYRSDMKTGIAAVKGKNNLAISQTVRRATGSTKDLLNPIVIMARQTMETVRAGRINMIAKALYDGAVSANDKTYLSEISRKKVHKSEVADLDPTELRPKANQVTFFQNGEKITLQVSSEIFAGFDAFTPQFSINNPIIKVVTLINNGFKKLVTSLNPGFIVRNSMRDIQDAGINSKYPKTFIKNYYIAATEIAKGGSYWNLYRAMGGSNVNYFDFDKGFKAVQSKMGFQDGWIHTIENANAFVECLPRLAEFISSIEAGNSAEQAFLDSADVTTNFARTGKITKALNSTVIPFLNPAVQGASKAIRNITSVKSAKEFAILATKAAIVGVLPFILNSLLYDDDEDYKDLRETDKENNYLLKIGDTFIKLPRGRVASVLAGAYNRTEKSLMGEDADWAGYLKNASTQMNPVENMARNIFSPFIDVQNNVTWYGSAIEGKEFENKSPSKRYDESTSSIAIALGGFLNYSPKKIHYILDQYSGVIGDFVLPATTKKAEKDFISGNFTIDPVTSNKLSDSFYDIYYDAQYAKSDDPSNTVAEYQVKHLNRVKKAIGELYDQKSEIQNSDIPDSDKLAQSHTLQILINEMYKTALNDYELITNAIIATEGVKDAYRYAEIQRLVYGAEEGLKSYNADVYASSKTLNKIGITYDNFYKYYFGIKDIQSDKDKNGNTISGSKKEKVIKKINSLKISTEKKLLLIAYSGYKLNEADKSKLLKYLNRSALTSSEKKELANKLGFELKYGKFY